MPRVPIEYLKDLKNDIKYAVETEIENDKGVVTVNSTDLENIEHVIKEWKHFRDALQKVQDYMHPGLRMPKDVRNQRIIEVVAATLPVQNDDF